MTAQQEEFHGQGGRYQGKVRRAPPRGTRSEMAYASRLTLPMTHLSFLMIGLLRTIALALFTLSLASCGGSGGSGGSDSPPSLAVNGDKDSFEFVSFINDQTPSQRITLTLDGGSGTYYGRVLTDQPSVIGASFVVQDTTTAVVTAAPGSESGSGTLSVRLCTDPACASAVWTGSIPYSVTRFFVSSSAEPMVSAEGEAVPITREFTLRPADTLHRLSVATATLSGGDWLSATFDGTSKITVRASSASLTSGRFQGDVALYFTGQPQGARLKVPLALTVGPGIVAPAAQKAVLTVSSTREMLAASVPIAFSGTQRPRWSASSDQPWLVVTTPSGEGPGAVRYTIDPAKASAIDNWSTGVATLSLSADGMSKVTVPITLEKKFPEIHAVAKSTVAPSMNHRLRVWGRGLSQLTSGKQVLIDGSPPANGVVMSDGEALLDVSSLAAGRRVLSVPNAAGVPSQTAVVTVADPAPLTYATTAKTGEKITSLLDPSRNAVFSVDRTNSQLVRYRLVGSQWVVDVLAVPTIGDMAMAPDRRTLYVVSNKNMLLAIDPDQLTIQSSYRANEADLRSTPNESKGLAATNNLRLWFMGTSEKLTYFDMMTTKFVTYPVPPSFNLRQVQAFVPADGSRIFMDDVASNDARRFVYTTSRDELAQVSNAPFVYRWSIFSEDGSKLFVDDGANPFNAAAGLYSASDFSRDGILESVSNELVYNSVLSPDATRLYAVVGSTQQNILATRIDVYDTTRKTPGTNGLVKLGQIAVPDQASICPRDSSSCNRRGAILVSPFDNTLFLVGNQRLVVLPIPESLRSAPAASSSRRLEAANQ